MNQPMNLVVPTFIKTIGTVPPKVTSIKWSIDLNTFKDRYVLPWSPIILRVSSPNISTKDRTPAENYHIRLMNIDTKETKSFICSADEIRLWERYEEYSDNDFVDPDTLKSLEQNLRVTVTPMNDNGLGPNSVFILPLANLISIGPNGVNNYPFETIFLNYWDNYCSEGIKPNYMFLYLDTNQETIESDYNNYLKEEWFVTTPLKNWDKINKSTKRWSVSSSGQYQTFNGVWNEMSSREIGFIDELRKYIGPIYQQHLTDKGISETDKTILKISFPDPMDQYNSIIMYVMKGTSWRI